MFLTGLTVLSYLNPLSANHLSATPLSCISMNNQEYKVRPNLLVLTVISLYFILFSIKTSKCSSSCNKINDPCAKMCAPDVVKN